MASGSDFLWCFLFDFFLVLAPSVDCLAMARPAYLCRSAAGGNLMGIFWRRKISKEKDRVFLF